MTLEIITEPLNEPLSTADAKAHGRQEDGTIEDALIASYVKSARRRVETYLRRKLINQTLRLSLSCFPSQIVLPMDPVSAVTSLTYLDPAGVRQTMAPENYRLVRAHGGSLVVPVRNGSWPVTLTDYASVQVDFTAGYGADVTSIPEDILQAVRLLVAHYAEHREAVVVGTGATDLPEGVVSHLAPYRRWI